MPYHIKKLGSIIDPTKTLYYKGENRWTEFYKDRKVFTYKKDATEEVTSGGSVVSE